MTYRGNHADYHVLFHFLSIITAGKLPWIEKQKQVFLPDEIVTFERI